MSELQYLPVSCILVEVFWGCLSHISDDFDFFQDTKKLTIPYKNKPENETLNEQWWKALCHKNFFHMHECLKFLHVIEILLSIFAVDEH